MTTDTTVNPAASKAAERAQALQNVGRYTQIAAKLLAGHDFKPNRRPGVARAFGLALAATSPRSGHGQVLAAALRPARWSDRPAEERAVFQLARRGETPTEAAVAAWLESRRRRQERWDRDAAAAAEAAAADGPRAAAYVAAVVRDTGQGPTWTELARAMEWPRQPWGLRNAIIRVLARDGWLATGTEPRSMRPGTRSETVVPAGGRR